MKNKIIVCLLLCIPFLPLYSQWGIKGGVNSSNMVGYESPEYRFGGHLGVTYEKQLCANWFFQPELLFSSWGTNIGDINHGIKKGYVSMYGLETPLNISFRPSINGKFRLVFDVGQYLRYGLWGERKSVYNSGTIENDVFEKLEYDYAYRRFDCGLNLGLGIQKDLYFGGFSWQYGYIEAKKESEYHHQVFKFSLGYKF